MNSLFTIWFYFLSLFQALTQTIWLSDVLALAGTSICMGWYASIFYEFFYYGLWFEALYKNMPMFFVQHMVREPPRGPVHWDTTEALVSMGVCHFFDFLGHPILTYYHYYKSTTVTLPNLYIQETCTVSNSLIIMSQFNI